MNVFTNVIFTAYFGNGQKMCILFSHNHHFNLNFAEGLPRNPLHQKWVDHVDTTLAHFDLTHAHIVYIPPATPPAGKKAKVKKLCKESKALTDMALERCNFPRTVTLLYDSGSCFSDELFDKYHIEDRKEYVAAGHEHLSPNDNNGHGRGKGPWKKLAKSHPELWRDDVYSSIYLLYLLLNDPPEHTIADFKRNLFYSPSGPLPIDRNVIMNQLTHGQTEAIGKSEFYTECLLKYLQQFDEEELLKRINLGITERKLLTSLDGWYWNEKIV